MPRQATDLKLEGRKNGGSSAFLQWGNQLWFCDWISDKKTHDIPQSAYCMLSNLPTSPLHYKIKQC